MARKAQQKPKTPQQIAADKLAQRRQDLEAANLPTDLASLNSADNIEVTRKGQKTELSARRADVFDLLKPGMAQGAYDAVRRLQHDMLVRTGLADRPPPTSRVDCTAGFTSDAALLAGDRVDAVRDSLPPRDWWLIVDLLTTDKPWRDRVGYITGEVNEHAQAAAMRAACVNLRDVTSTRRRKAA